MTALARPLYLGAVAAVYAFLLAPIAIVVLASFNAGEYLTFPPSGLSLKWYGKFFSMRPFTEALLLSLRVALISTGRPR